MNLKRTLHLVGPIEDKTICDLLIKITDLASKGRTAITLFICSGGGSASVALAFYDFVRGAKINLITIAVGDTSSAAIIIWLAGRKRFVSPSASMAVHTVKQTQRKDGIIEIEELGLLVARGNHWSKKCAELVALNSGVLTQKAVTRMMQKRRLLTSDDLILFKLADGLFK